MAGTESAGAASSSVGGIAEEGITVKWWRFRHISPRGGSREGGGAQSACAEGRLYACVLHA